MTRFCRVSCLLMFAGAGFGVTLGQSPTTVTIEEPLQQMLRIRAVNLLEDITGERIQQAAQIDFRTEELPGDGAGDAFHVLRVTFSTGHSCAFDTNAVLRSMTSPLSGPKTSGTEADAVQKAEEVRQKVFNEYVTLSGPVLSRSAISARYFKMTGGLRFWDESLTIGFGEDYQVRRIENSIRDPFRPTILHPKVTLQFAMDKIRRIAMKLPSTKFWTERYPPRNPKFELDFTEQMVFWGLVKPNDFFRLVEWRKGGAEQAADERRWVYVCAPQFWLLMDGVRSVVISPRFWIDIETGELIGGEP